MFKFTAKRMSQLSRFVSVDEVERHAVKVLPQSVRDYYQSGADNEQTLARNSRMFAKYLIRPVALRDVSQLDTTTKIVLKGMSGALKYEHTFDFPIAIAPTAFQRMAHSEGESATATAAGQTNTLMVNSTISTTRLEDVAKAGKEYDTQLFFQLYVYKDRAVTESLVRRAEEAGFKALVLTVDAPTFGRRRADERNGFELPKHLEMANFADFIHSKTKSGEAGASGLAAYTNSLFDQSLNWEDLAWLVKNSRLPIIVKGVMRADDAQKAIEYGASAIIVSNHGGRQLDHAPATIEALPEVVKAVNRQVPVFIDGGFRCGTDVFKALALGADLCFVGRPIIHGLAVGGVDGVKHVLNILRTEFKYALLLSGCPSIKAIRETKDIVVHENYYAKL
ncbi:unnamed protein product [Bursaphelenchus okinawaensis]|uniref:(S)-2-hydroxy-acid oxidase n=1 Tax=Bursaphelenchus okinawaensis TaxID=465554 RepID=A0A811JUS9_9BILA|nr:unnamed protein product [Bursaphelenchus okinawaensis]CAG9083942.1 unnamed protein product [Bursaphelenchus okinawaensis]